MFAGRLVTTDDAEEFLAVLSLDGVAAVRRLRDDGVGRNGGRGGLR